MKEIIGKTAASAMTQLGKKVSPNEAKLLPDMSRAVFSAGRRPDTSNSQDAGMVLVTVPGILDEWPRNRPGLSII